MGDPLAESTRPPGQELSVLGHVLGYAERQLGGVLSNLREVRDERVRPQIPGERVVLSLFVMALARLGSLNALEQTARLGPWRRILGGGLPSADTLGRVANVTDTDDLRRVHHDLYARLKRNKALPAPEHGLLALVLDGHESTASYRRCCPGCLKRTIKTSKGERTQYYHRYVAASLVGEGFHYFVDLEEIAPGEGEVAAALRLLHRVHAAYPRAYDVVLGDSLYAQAPFFMAVLALGKDVLVVLKQKDRDLYSDALALCEMLTPSEFVRANGTRVRCWDVEDLTSWSSLDRPVRVVRTTETSHVKRQLDGELEERRSEWMWITTLNRLCAPAPAVVYLGHSRWDIENQGFNEAVNRWHMDHVYRHEPRAMRVLLLITMLAMNVLSAFYRRALKPARRARESMLHVARCIAAALYCGRPLSGAPT